MIIFFPVPTCDVYPIEIASRTCWAFIQRVFFCWAFIQRVFFLLTMSFWRIKIPETPGEYVNVFGAISPEI